MRFPKDLRIWKSYKIIAMFIEITEFTGNKLHINTDHIVSFNKNINGTTIRMINGETIIVNVSIDDFKKYYLKME